MGDQFILSVFDSSDRSLGQLKLTVDGTKTIKLWNQDQSSQIQEWSSTTDTPRFEKQLDGPSIRIGFKRYVISTSHTQSDVDNWLSSVDEILVPETQTEDTQATAEGIVRLCKMFESGDLTADELVLLISKKIGTSPSEVQRDFAHEQLISRLDEQSDLIEFQRLWTQAFKNNVPASLDQHALYTRLLELKGDVARLSQDWIALTNLAAEQFNLGFLAKGELSNEITRAMKRNRPLPPMATQAISNVVQELNSLTSPIRQFAKRMGWRDMPTF
jgi:hypothetical protein